LVVLVNDHCRVTQYFIIPIEKQQKRYILNIKMPPKISLPPVRFRNLSFDCIAQIILKTKPQTQDLFYFVSKQTSLIMTLPLIYKMKIDAEFHRIDISQLHENAYREQYRKLRIGKLNLYDQADTRLKDKEAEFSLERKSAFDYKNLKRGETATIVKALETQGVALNEALIQNTARNCYPFVPEIFSVILNVIEMERVHGITIHDYMTKGWNYLDFQYIYNRVIYIITRLHKCGIVHGDVHLKNFMITRNKDIYVIDFGYSYFTKIRNPDLLEADMARDLEGAYHNFSYLCYDTFEKDKHAPAKFKVPFEKYIVSVWTQNFPKEYTLRQRNDFIEQKRKKTIQLFIDIFSGKLK
jgi:tRNA A-37 threonylcarbamoyl transferase component Bud32